jgi:DNA-binding protein YbaB
MSEIKPEAVDVLFNQDDYEILRDYIKKYTRKSIKKIKTNSLTPAQRHLADMRALVEKAYKVKLP